MRARRLAACAFVLALAIASPVAVAGDAAGEPPATDLKAVHAQQTGLLAEVRAGTGVFADMDRLDREELASDQVELLALIEGKAGVAELRDGAQLRAFNLLQRISTAVESAEEEARLVCESIRSTGSHLRTRECKTIAERRRDREDSQRYLETFRRGLCFKNGLPCGG